MNIYNYNHLFYFYVTAKLNGVTVAAKHLNTSQSSLSTQIKTLESVLGRPVFKKVGRKIELTKTGKEMFNYCRRAFEVFDEMFDQLDRKQSSMGTRISVGVSVDIERPFITDALSKVSRSYGKEQRPLINLVSLPSTQLIELLRVGEIDLLLTNNLVVDHEVETLGQFEFTVGAFASAEIADLAKDKTLEGLVRNSHVPFVLPSSITSLRAEIDGLFIRKKLSPVCVFESNIIAAVIRAAVDGMGATILPEVYIAREIKSGKLIPIASKLMWKHRMSLLVKRGGLEEEREGFAKMLIGHFDHIAEQSKQLS
jgi:LysR family transcriptional activator of nhaA